MTLGSLERALPGSVLQVDELDPALGAAVRSDVIRLMEAAEAQAWAQSFLADFLVAGSPQAVITRLLETARDLTGVDSAWALGWKGEMNRGEASVHALASSGDPESQSAIPTQEEIASSIVGRVSDEGHPVWSDNAVADERFESNKSVHALGIRSVGCIPIGRRGVLYLQDTTSTSRFEPHQRTRLAALCQLAASFLEAPPGESPTPSLPSPEIEGLVGDAPTMRDLRAAIAAFAPMPWPALILGETGCGKERVARSLHLLSAVSEEPFVAVNCGTISEQLAESTLFGHERGAFTGADRRREGVVERVGRGTLFLDEIGELPPAIQVKLLRLLQEGVFERVGGEEERRFEGRIVAATHRDLDDEDQRGSFRDDLFHRLSACVLRVPSLADRREDIPLLARHLLGIALSELKDAPSLTLGADALHSLSGRAWPGNVRELENVLRAAIARTLAAGGDEIHLAQLVDTPSHRQGEDRADEIELPTDLSQLIEGFQKRVVRKALGMAEGNRTRAAELLGVSRQWLHRLIARWDDLS